MEVSNEGEVSALPEGAWVGPMDGDGWCVKGWSWWVMGLDGGRWWMEGPVESDVAYSVEEGAVADSVAPRPSRLSPLTRPGKVGTLKPCPIASHRSHFLTDALSPLCYASKWGPQLRPLGSVMLGRIFWLN